MVGTGPVTFDFQQAHPQRLDMFQQKVFGHEVRVAHCTDWLCDQCQQPIEPGEEYKRSLFRLPNGRLRIIRYHYPYCPCDFDPDEDCDWLTEDLRDPDLNGFSTESLPLAA